MNTDVEEEVTLISLVTGEIHRTTVPWGDLKAEQEEDEDLLTPSDFAQLAGDPEHADVFAFWERTLLVGTPDLRQTFVVRPEQSCHVFLFTDQGFLCDEPHRGRQDGRLQVETFCQEWEMGYFELAGAEAGEPFGGDGPDPVEAFTVGTRVKASFGLPAMWCTTGLSWMLAMEL